MSVCVCLSVRDHIFGTIHARSLRLFCHFIEKYEKGVGYIGFFCKTVHCIISVACFVLFYVCDLRYLIDVVLCPSSRQMPHGDATAQAARPIASVNDGSRLRVLDSAKR